MKNDIKKIGNYPSPFVNDKVKETKEYGLSYFKKMYEDWAGKSNQAYEAKRRRFLKNRRYAEGIQDVAKYKDLLDVEGDTSYLNLDWSQVSIVPKFTDVVVNGLINQDYDVLASAVDDIAVDEKQMAKQQMITKMLANPFLEKMSQMTGQDLQDKGFIPSDMDEVEIHMQLNHKLEYEIAIEQVIKYVMENNNFEEVKHRLLRDLVVLNIGVIKTDTHKERGVVINYVDPINFVTSYSTNPSFSGIQHAGEVRTITISELKKMASDQLTEEEYETIANLYRGKNGNPNSYSNAYTYDSSTESYSFEYDDFSVDILEGEFLSINKYNFEKKENNFGTFSINKKDYDYEPSKKTKTKREKISKDIKVVYKGKYFIGTDYIFDYALAENMTRKDSDLSETSLSYIVYAPNLFRMVNKSLVERMIPFADQIQIAHLKLQQLIAKARPKGLMIEVGGLEGVVKWDGGELNPLELQNIYDQTGNFYYRRKDDDGNMTNYPPIQELENGIGRDVVQLIQIYNHNLQMIRDVTGINEMRDASTPDKDSLVGVQKMALLASNNATRGINSAYLNIVKRMSEEITLRAKDILLYDKPFKIYTSALGKGTMNVLKVNKDVGLHEYGITLQVAPDDQERAMLEQNIQISLAQKELKLEDAMLIRDVKNIKLANQLLAVRRKRHMQEQQMIAQQQSQMNAQMQQQSLQMNAQIKEREAQVEGQVESQLLQIKGQNEQNRLQAEYQLKEQFEQAQHQRKLVEIEMMNKINSEKEDGKEDRRDKRVDKTAHNQSKLIEQRKGTGAPIENPDDKVNIEELEWMKK